MYVTVILPMIVHRIVPVYGVVILTMINVVFVIIMLPMTVYRTVIMSGVEMP